MHNDKKRLTNNKKVAKRPVSLSKAAKTINAALALTLRNSLNLWGLSSSISHSLEKNYV
jgi:hypothetical protein